MEEVINCPHCNEFIIIEQINCGIFRHGVFRDTLIQIPPHEQKNICDELYTSGKIIGCGRPFRYDGKEASICDYI